MSATRGRIERLEQRLAGAGRPPVAVQLAIRRMEAREARFEETCLEALSRLQAELAAEDGRPPSEPDAFTGDETRRFERARRLLSDDDDAKHRADRDRILAWERTRQRGPRAYARRWTGDWQRRRLTEALDGARQAVNALVGQADPSLSFADQVGFSPRLGGRSGCRA